MRLTPKFERVCKNCEIVFLVTKTMESSGRKIYCSRKCMAEGYSKGHNPHIQKDKIQRFCKNCNKEFLAGRYQVEKKKGGNFCSRACRNTFHCKGKHLSKDHKEKLVISAVKRDLTPELRKIYRQAGFVGGVKTQMLQRDKKGLNKLEQKVFDFLSNTKDEFESQRPIKWFIVDFYIPKYNLVIEADGLYWHSLPESIKRDANKNAYLLASRYNLLRLPEDKINSGEFKSIILEKISEIENKHIDISYNI